MRVEVELEGESVVLLAERALYWPRHRRLVIADLHLGKADVFRRAGIALPRGGTTHDLLRLERLVEATGADELFVLGDLLHGPVPPAAWRETFASWRERNARVRVAVVAGNHDRELAGAGLDVEIVPAVADAPPFLLAHHPRARAGRTTLCGHLHPVLTLPGIRRRWPCFWLRRGLVVLPAFSAFTGGLPVELGEGERAAVCAGGEIILVGAPAR